ncbi:hypothetical protein BUALT_Bualt18G0097100 [Buddleja alternifolia]|uniref:TRASH domain-containing protein n=1 Tax=Buddleja alternifolia TaxID=168488 RepID=A0AAV6WEI0_9LAMI|nr:hypothetical protein BUALT_Bualt18G0097100 [Buddleja alternifolia]
MSNNKIDCYFKKRCSQDNTSSPILETSSTVISEASPTKVQKLDQDSNCLNIERDPGLRKPIWDYSIDERDKIRRAYLKAGPYQGIPKYSLQHVDRHGRRFLPTWYKRFSDCEIINDKTGSSPKAAADGAYDLMMSFEFVLILHFVIELLEMTDDLCEILQYKSQDILNAMDAVTNTKELIQKFRESGWDDLFDKVKIFCEKREIDIPDMSAPHRSGRGRLRKENPIILEHHYRVDIFTSTIDSILQEMNYRFDENAVELLRLSSALDPKDGYKSFNINEICTLVEKFYPKDFNDHEKLHMKYQLADGHKRLTAMVLKTELCRFSGAKIYPGRGIRFIRSDSQVFLFANSKCKRYFHNRLRPAKLTWTAVYRKQHKKDAAAEAVKKRRRATKKPYSRSIVGATLEVIQKRRTEKPEVRDAAREAALREIKERIKKTKDEKKAKKVEVMSKQKTGKSNVSKGAAPKGPKLGGGGGKR